MPHIDVIIIYTCVFSESGSLTNWSVLSAGYPTWHVTISVSLLEVHLTSVSSLWGGKKQQKIMLRKWSPAGIIMVWWQREGRSD